MHDDETQTNNVVLASNIIQLDIKLYELIKQKACQKSHALNTLAYKFL